MRVAAPRRRGPAGLRNLFRFCRNCGLFALRSGSFRVSKIGGGITTLGVLCVLLKLPAPACQKGQFAVSFAVSIGLKLSFRQLCIYFSKYGT